jgi:hypothetical protein
LYLRQVQAEITEIIEFAKKENSVFFEKHKLAPW